MTKTTAEREIANSILRSAHVKADNVHRRKANEKISGGQDLARRFGLRAGDAVSKCQPSASYSKNKVI